MSNQFGCDSESEFSLLEVGTFGVTVYFWRRNQENFDFLPPSFNLLHFCFL